MQIQVNTDNNIQGSEELTREASAIAENALGRFADRITRLEIHITDENSKSKSVGNDKRCVIEARLAGRQPVTASDQADTVRQVIAGAAGKLERLLERTLQRRQHTKGGRSAAGEE